MSTWRDPVGPKSKNVYLRRRLLVLLGLLALIVAVVLIIVKPGGSGSAATTPKVEVPEGLSSQQTEDPAKSEKPEKNPKCEDADLEVLAITDRESYAAGEKPKLSLSVTNTGKKPCTADLGTAGMVFSVTSGSDQVWLSTDCQKTPDHRPVILEPGKALKTEPLAWDRTRSSKKTCEVDREQVAAGGASYHLAVSVAGVESQQTAQFLLY